MSRNVEYVEYQAIRDNLEKFYSIFINKNEGKSQKHIPFLKKSFDNYIETATDNSRITNATPTLLSVNNFAELQSQALKGKIHHTTKAVENGQSLFNSNNTTIGFLNFTKRDDDINADITSVNTVADNYIVIKSTERTNLIYTTIEIIEIFINILEAYKNFIIKSQQKNISLNNITDIFIVGRKVKKIGDMTSDNMAVYVENSTQSSHERDYKFPASNTLFLIIKSFDNDIMNNYTAPASTTDVYKKYYKKFYNFNNDGNPIINSSSSTIKEEDLFSEDEISLNTTSVFSGILLSKSINGTTIQYNKEPYVADLTDLTDINKNFNHETNKKLCSVILKNFLCYLHDLERTDINIQINALLYYYKIMKCYLLNSVLIGNYLFNTKYENGSNSTGAGHQLTTIAAIDPIITNTTKITDRFKPLTSTSTEWDYLMDRNTFIRNTLNNLSKEIENSIDGNNVQNNSIIHPSVFKGFYVKKISDILIELSPVLSPLRKNISDNPFPTYLKNHNTSQTSNKIFFDYRGNIIYDLSDEEKHLASILKNSSIANIKEKIKSDYQIEINKNLYTIHDIFIESTEGIKSISRINILAKFDYLTPPASSANTSKLFNFERNTYDVFPDKKDITPTNISIKKEVVLDVFDTSGKVKSESVIVGKYILLYNYDEHPTVNNHVIFNKNVDLKKTYNEDMDELKNINTKIVLNESKINNSGRLYDIQDKEYSILYNQLIVYCVVIAILFCIIIIINYADIEFDMVVNVTTVCFITIVILIISYYLVDIVYIEKYVNVENFNIEHFNLSNQFDFKYTDGSNETSGINTKLSYIQASMNGLSNKIDRIVKILMVAIPQVEFVETKKFLNGIIKNEKNEKIYVNELLDHKRINSYNFIDIKKYDITALNTLIKTVLATALVIFGIYTMHFYVDNKYNDTLIFMCAIFLIIIFTFYIIYSYRVVRTISKNVYWGKEFETSYE